MAAPLLAPLSPEWLKANYLEGVSTTDDDNEDFAQSQLLTALRSAVAGVATKLNVCLAGVKTFTERHDVLPTDRGSYYIKQLRQRPVRTITRAWLQFGVWDANEISTDRITIKNEKTGRLEIVPGPGSIAGIGISLPLGVNAMRQPWDWTTTRLPGYLKVEYTAGFTDEDGDYPIPDDILHVIGLRAARPILITAGDLIIGAGIANESLSMDGISESIGSTSSATNNGYGARVKENKEEYDDCMSDLLAAYRGANFAGM